MPVAYGITVYQCCMIRIANVIGSNATHWTVVEKLSEELLGAVPVLVRDSGCLAYITVN